MTAARARWSWLRDGSQVAQQQTLRTYGRALDASFTVKGRGRPTFKARKNTLPSLEYTRRGFRICDDRLVLPKGVSVPVVWSRELPTEPSSVRIFRDSLGHWYASFVVTRDSNPTPGAPEGSAIGINWGVTPDRDHHRRAVRSAAPWTPEPVCGGAGEGPTQDGAPPPEEGTSTSRGYKDARTAAAKVHKKAARQNLHDGRVWAKTVVGAHRVIAVEDFRPRFLAKSSMARKAADAAVAAVKRELVERGRRAGRKVVVVVRPAYTSMTCSGCFARARQRLGLGERIFRCWACGHTACRDRNAAGVILAVAERGHTGVDDVSQSNHLPRGGGAVAV